ncbi:hypothetical protein [Vibrio vulnificus]|uniref:hypothetical protein n=1 Tax=Vibrio vulnificus TaxID=672 RepID=UPI003242D089
MKVNISGTWKHGIPHVNVGGAWKQGHLVYQNVGGVWKPMILHAPTTSTLANASIKDNVTHKFTATFDNKGDAGTKIQWYRNGAAISGATATTYTTPTQAAGTYKYKFTVTNAAGSATSNEATLTVTASGVNVRINCKTWQEENPNYPPGSGVPPIVLFGFAGRLGSVSPTSVKGHAIVMANMANLIANRQFMFRYQTAQISGKTSIRAHFTNSKGAKQSATLKWNGRNMYIAEGIQGKGSEAEKVWAVFNGMQNSWVDMLLEV